MSNFLSCVWDENSVCVNCKKHGRQFCEVLINAFGHAEITAEAKDSQQTLVGGPGTELSKLLANLGIKAAPMCHCVAKAAEMDAWGPDECERPERIQEVLAVMKKEAGRRGLPFLEAVGRMLIRRAIANWRRIQSRSNLRIYTPPPAESG